MAKRYIGIGASAASLGAVNKLKMIDPTAQILLFSAEKELPYNKCFLADFLSGISTREKVHIYRHSPSVTLHLNTRITHIDPVHQTVTTEHGATFEYDELFLGMGSSPYVPAIEGITSEGVFSFHTLADTLAIQDYIKKYNCKKAIICGAGLSGLEAADALHAQGLAVTIVEKNTRVLPSLLTPLASDFLHEHTGACNVNLLLGQGVTGIETAQGQVKGIYTDKDTFIPGDILIVATGLQPNTPLCEGAHITYGQKGIPVNEYMQTNQPHIYAGGDLIQVTDLLTGNALRSCMWPDAMQQGMYAALVMAGQPKPYPGAAIIISSAFFGLKFAQAGLLENPDHCQGTDFYHEMSLKNGTLQGFLVLGRRHDLGLLRRLILTKQPVLDSVDSLFKP